LAAAVSKLLRKAARHLEKGERCEAEALYADILVKFPKNRTALLGREKSQQAPASKLCDPPKETVDEVIASHRQGEFEKILTRVEPLLQVFPSALFFSIYKEPLMLLWGVMRRALIVTRKL
jgi:hypothetical protein